MTPKQAAALLTNENQYLIHILVKGVKGKYNTLISWYSEVYQYSKYLSSILQSEIELANNSNNENKIKAAQLNFEKMLQALACGCYSKNYDLASLCIKTLTSIASDFNDQMEMVRLTNKWL